MVVVPAENIQFGTFLFPKCFKNISFYAVLEYMLHKIKYSLHFMIFI